MMFPSVEIRLPPWVEAVARPGSVFPTVEDRMRLAISLARRNVEEGEGPFGAAVFDRATHRLIAPGVNRVVSANCSVAHAEIVAIALAQNILGHYDLSRTGARGCELVASTEPCAMCMGAIPWSGVQSLVCGARGEDACAVGFDEGTKPVNWPQSLEARGIAVLQDMCRSEAIAVLDEYRRRGGPLYNSRRE